MTAQPLRIGASSHLAAARYDADTETLEIDFTDASSYTYYRVPNEVAFGLERAPSPGSYFHRWVKGRYAYA